MPSNRTSSSVPTTPLDPPWQISSFDAKKRQAESILRGEYVQLKRYNNDIDNPVDTALSRPESPKVTGPIDLISAMASRDTNVPPADTQSPFTLSTFPRNSRHPDDAPITTIRLRTGSSSSSPGIQTFLFRASREGYPSIPPSFSSHLQTNPNFATLQNRQNTEFDTPDGSERRNSSPMSVANLLSTPTPQPINIPAEKSQPRRGNKDIRFRNYFQQPPRSGRGSRKASQSEQSASERSSTPQVPSREQTAVEAADANDQDVSTPKLRAVTNSDSLPVATSGTVAPLLQGDAILSLNLPPTSTSTPLNINTDADEPTSVRRSGRVRKPVAKIADEIFDNDLRPPVVKPKKLDLAPAKVDKDPEASPQVLTPSPENQPATDVGNVRSSGRVRKPTLKAIEALQSQAQDRKDREKPAKSLTPPAEGRDVMSKSQQQPPSAGSDVSKSDKRKGPTRSNESKDVTLSPSHTPSHHTVPASTLGEKPLSKHLTPEIKNQLEVSLASTSQLTPTPSKRSPKFTCHSRKPTKTQLNLIAKRLFELAASALSPENLESPDAQIDIEKMRAEFFAKSKAVDQQPQPEPEQEQVPDSLPSSEQQPPIVEAILQPNTTDVEDTTSPPPLPPGFDLVDSSVVLDHPGHSRPWIDGEGWTHTGQANKYAEEAVFVPNSYAWVPEPTAQPNLDVPSPPPRVGSCVQVEKDKEFRYPPVLGGRNTPRILAGKFVPENVMQEGLRAKAFNCALQKGIIVDMSMSFDEIRQKIEEHDGPDAPRRSWLKLKIMNSKTLEGRDIQDNTTAEDHRKRRQSAPANVAGNIAQSPKSRKRNRASVDHDGSAEVGSTPETVHLAKKARSTGKVQGTIDKGMSSNKRKRGPDSVHADDVVPTAANDSILTPNASSGSKRQRVDDKAPAQGSPSLQARPRRKNAGALLAQIQNELEPVKSKGTPGLPRPKSVSNLTRSVSVNHDAETPKTSPVRKNSA